MKDKIREWFSDGYIRRKIISYTIIIIFMAMVSLSLSYNIHTLLTGGEPELWSIGKHIEGLKTPQIAKMFLIFISVAGLLVMYMIFSQNHLNYSSGSIRVTPKIKTPRPAGNGQYGTAQLSTQSEMKKLFQTIKMSDIRTLNTDGAFKSAGIYLGVNRGKSECYCMSEDTHSIVIGSTGSGKTRGLVLQTLCLLAMSGESMIVSDPKSELYLYTKELLHEKGYNVVVLDFIQFAKSNKYNFLQPIIDAVNVGDIAEAITKANDLVDILVASDHANESIWVDGERAVIAAAILAVVYDNMKKPQYQNLTNVYYFLENMCKPNARKEMPITIYVEMTPPNHPVRSLIGISEMAPEKMRGSFYTSALTTLRLFTSLDVYNMTYMTDFDIYNTSKEKTAIFMILPDEKATYYSIASLFVTQQYQMLRDEGYKKGGRLGRRVNYILDEFGNFAKIGNFTKHITVGRGCGIKYYLFLQDFHQLKKVYGDDDAKIIRANCETCVYLRSGSVETRKEMSDALGRYTIKSASVSASNSGSSASYNYTGRELLTSDEINEIDRPYQLVMYRGKAAMMYSPDIAKTPFNRILGLGNKNHNQALFIKRNDERKSEKKILEIPIWRIWEINNY